MPCDDHLIGSCFPLMRLSCCFAVGGHGPFQNLKPQFTHIDIHPLTPTPKQPHLQHHAAARLNHGLGVLAGPGLLPLLFEQQHHPLRQQQHGHGRHIHPRSSSTSSSASSIDREGSITP